MTIELVTRL